MSDAFRLLHSADLHLGRQFGNLPEAVRFRLIEARHQILPRLARAARESGARDILLAGDTFDSETPSAAVWKQALNAMAAAADLRWWLLPGNHDSLAAEPLWEALARHAPPNLHLVVEPAPVDLAPGVVLLPAPLPRRRPGRDLTRWMAEAATPEGALRLGLAHGPVLDFAEEGSAADGTIAPDRARLAGLDYLALGDWHGAMQIDPRTAYSGTPEAEGFRHAGRGMALAVALRPGALPEVARLPLGQFHWAEVVLPLVPGLDPLAAFSALLPIDAAERRDHLLRIRASGRASLAAHQALQRAAEAAAPDFAHFRLDTTALEVELAAGDLDSLDHSGALRNAAEALAAEAADPALPPETRRIAAGALTRLQALLDTGA